MNSPNPGRLPKVTLRRVGRWATLVVLVIAVAAAPSVWGQGPSRSAPPEPWMEAPPTSTGLAVGQKIPAFRAPDQRGRMQDFRSIRGPKGVVIAFNRSADW